MQMTPTTNTAVTLEEAESKKNSDVLTQKLSATDSMVEKISK